MSLAEARSEATGMLLELRKGRDPKLRGITLKKVLALYLEKRGGKLSDNSIDSYSSHVNGHLSVWLDAPLKSITQKDVTERHAAIASEICAAGKGKGETSANAAMRTLRALWNFARRNDPSLPENPVALRGDWFAETRRERIVEESQMRGFYQAVQNLKNDIARDYILFVLFTGLRRREAGKLQWEHVDFANRCIRIPADNTKARRKLDLPMTDFVRNLLVARRSIGREQSGFVFPSNGKKTGYLAEPKFPLDAVGKACGVYVSVHDLRRTFITVAEEAEISPLALKALVNHALGKDVTEGYVQMRVERLRSPAQRVADRLKELCGIATLADANVVAAA